MSDNKSETAFRTISEVAEELGVQQHVLRFWETKFTQIKPMKRGGGRRYYRPEDVAMVKKIHSLLYVEGYTNQGVQKLLKGLKSQILEQKKVLPPQKRMHIAIICLQFQTPEQNPSKLRMNYWQKKKLQQVEILQSVWMNCWRCEQVRQILSDDVQAA